MQQKMFTSRINVFFFSTQCTLTALSFLFQVTVAH